MKYFLSLLFILFFTNLTFANNINVVAAENFYGSIAATIGGKHVSVRSILNNPNQDPHLFSANPSIAKAITTADVVVYNGLGYDAWITQLLHNQAHPQAILIAADLIQAQMGDNPHIWYKPATSIAVAKALMDTYIKLDPKNTADYQQNYAAFDKSYNAYLARIDAMKTKYQNIKILATEPVFNYLAESLGFTILGLDFQLSIMNDVPPSPQQIIRFQNVILNHQVKFLVYNVQVSNPITRRMQDFANSNAIPVVGVSETEPANMDFLSWMNFNLNAVETALNQTKNTYGSYHI